MFAGFFSAKPHACPQPATNPTPAPQQIPWSCRVLHLGRSRARAAPCCLLDAGTQHKYPCSVTKLPAQTGHQKHRKERLAHTAHRTFSPPREATFQGAPRGPFRISSALPAHIELLMLPSKGRGSAPRPLPLRSPGTSPPMAITSKKRATATSGCCRRCLCCTQPLSARQHVGFGCGHAELWCWS